MLALCSAVAEHEADAAVALTRWEELQRVAEQEHGRERRFRRRAFERARDRALQTLAMRLKPSMLKKRPEAPRSVRVRRHRTKLSRRAIA